MPMSEAANDAVDWEISVRDGEVWILWPDRKEMVNLGPAEAVFGRLAELMAAEDFGE